MQLGDFAESILFGTTLESKLLRPDSLEDAAGPQAIKFPSFPGRPDSLKPKAKKRTEFPKDSQLESDWGRAAVLHFFANHELLAMELMALALLKFPDAPKSFRIGLAQTIREEQDHLLLYQQRMNQLGMEFGDIGVNDFFWSCLKDMKSPMDYISGMSLTFEQANLDYSLHYLNLMGQIGDQDTKELLSKVYNDEIGHVKYGVYWFDRLRSPDSTQWDAYRQAMFGRQPLTLSRAKGIGFDSAGRKKAGLDRAYIESLEFFDSPKGRCPSLYIYNADCELEAGHGKLGYQTSDGVRLLMSDFEGLPFFVAKKGDCILGMKKPSVTYQKYLRDRTGRTAEFIVWDGRDKSFGSVTKNRSFSELKPWGWTPKMNRIEQDLRRTSFRFKSGPVFNDTFSKAYWKTTLPSLRKELRKFPVLDQLFGPPITDGVTLRDLDEVINYIDNIHATGHPAVVKSKFGFSGSGQCRIYPQKGVSQSQIAWMKRQLSLHLELVVEPWLTRLLDGSFVWASKDDRAQASFFLTDEKGKYKGHKLGSTGFKVGTALSPYLLAHLTEQPSVLDSLASIAVFVQEQLRQLGYSGPAGFDYIVYRWPQTGQVFVKGLGEVNSRMTMAHIALSLESEMQIRGPALWLTLSLLDLRNAGFTSVKCFCDFLRNEIKEEKHILFTNDPECALGAISFLVMEPELMLRLQEIFDLRGVDL